MVEKLEQGNVERRYGGQNIVSLKLLFASSFVLGILGLFPSLLRLFELGSIMGEFSHYTSSCDRNSACQFKCMTLTSIL
jgi:hypothetical protein